MRSSPDTPAQLHKLSQPEQRDDAASTSLLRLSRLNRRSVSSTLIVLGVLACNGQTITPEALDSIELDGGSFGGGKPPSFIVPHEELDSGLPPEPEPEPTPPAIVCPEAIGVGGTSIIDDFERVTGGEVPVQDGRDGSWYDYSDGSGMDPNPSYQDFQSGIVALQAPETGFAFHGQGSGYKVWGGGYGFTLHRTDFQYCQYDASAYTGIRFRARSDQSDTISVKIVSMAVVPVFNGGSCTADCWGTHESYLDLSPEWITYTVYFQDLTIPSWAPDIGPVNLKETLEVQFQRNSSGSPVSFDYWLDDIEFISDPAPLPPEAMPIAL